MSNLTHSDITINSATSGYSTILNTDASGAFNISADNAVSISACGSGGGGSYTSSGGTYPIYPYTTGTPITITPADRDELKSVPKEAGPTSHSLRGILRIYGDSVVVEYFCSHCKDVLHRQVISKVPKELTNKKCLPRIVDGV